jgi:hypothetical protein
LNKINTDGTRTAVVSRTLINTSISYYPSLTIGNYELVATVDGSNQQANISIDFYRLDIEVIKNKICGGIRISQIINQDPITGQLLKKSYKYRLSSDTAKSSGGLVADINLIAAQGPFAFQNGCGRLVRSSYSNTYLGVTQGSHIGYQQVTEIQEGNTGNGKREVFYTGVADYPNTSVLNTQYATGDAHPVLLMQMPPSPKYLTDYDFCRGLQVKEIIYNANGNRIKVNDVTYNISTALNPSSPNYYQLGSTVGYAVPYLTVKETDGSERTNEERRFINVVTVMPWIVKTSSTDTLYDMNGNNPITTITNYFYDNAVHAQLTRVEVVNSKGETIKTVYKFPDDKSDIAGLSASAGNALTAMVAMHKIAPVIEQSRYKNGILLDLSRKDYRIWDPARNIIEPERIWSQLAPYPMEAVTDFLSYDTTGNILSMAKSNDAIKSYIWDFRNQYPVAAATNANFSDIAYSSFEADGNGNWTVPSTVRDVATPAITGSSSYVLSNGSIRCSGLAAATTYIVSYWSRNGSYSLSGSTQVTAGITLNGWTYYEHRVTGINTLTVNGTGNIDELRLYPLGAQMETFTYSPIYGITSQCSASSQITYYSYDGFGRLKLVKNQNGMILKQFDYQYQQLATQ